MEKVFRTSLVDQISIQLDKEGLNGLDVKEELVLISDQLVQLDKQIVSSNDLLGQKIDESTAQICERIDKGNLLLLQEIHALGNKIDHLEQKVVEGNELLRQDIKLVHQELVDLRKTIGFWAKVGIGTIWAVIASLIANLIFRLLGG